MVLIRKVNNFHKTYQRLSNMLNQNFTLSSLSYSDVRVIASRILHEIYLLIGELAIRRTNLTLIVKVTC